MRYAKYALLAALAAFCLLPATAAQARDRYYYGGRSSFDVSVGYSNYGRHGGFNVGLGYGYGSRGYYRPSYYSNYVYFGAPLLYRPSYYCEPTYYVAPRYVRYYDAPTYYYRPRPVYREYYYESGPIYRNTRVYFRDDYYR